MAMHDETTCESVCLTSSIAVYLEAFLRSLDIRDSSKETYKRQLMAFFIWLSSQDYTAPDRETILAYKDYLRTKKQLTAFTIGGYITAIRRFFEWLESVKKYPNIARSVRGPRRRAGFRKDALTLDQVYELLAAIDRSTLDGKRDYALINLMVRTGLRTIEITRATFEDITKNNGAMVLWIQGKGRDSKDELVILTERALGPIKEYLHSRGATKSAAPLFVSHSNKNFGQSLTTRSVSRIVKNRLAAIHIVDPRITAHSLRHTAITLSMLAGATPQEARIMARHADINTTLIYAHNINRVKNAPEHKIDDLLSTCQQPKKRRLLSQ